jgi:hypothetical protein
MRRRPQDLQYNRDMPSQPSARRAATVPVAAAAAILMCGMGGGGGARPGQGTARPDPVVRSVALSAGTLPIAKEHRYRMSAKIRPLLFWIGKDNVGGARIRWHQGEGEDRGYDLLIGSDPRRAPRKVNRWGFIQEESRGGEATVLGVIQKSDQDTLEAAQADAVADGQQAFFWKMIQGKTQGSESVATVTLTRVGKDYSYRDLDTLLDALVRFPGPPRVKKAPVPAGGQPGFLTALVALVHDTVEQVRATGRAPGRKTIGYAYFGSQYDVVRTDAAIKVNQVYGGRSYPKLVDTDFEVRPRAGARWVESFTLVLGVDGDLAEVPVFVSYQPKWWFRADMVLDERETF